MRDLRSLVNVMRLMRRLRPDVVNASTPKAGLLGMVGAWICRVPRRVYVVRGLRFETASGWRRQVLRALERGASSRATNVVYNSRSLLSTAERERTIRRGRGVVLGAGSGNGIEASRFSSRPTKAEARRLLGLDPTLPVVGFVGRLTRDKGLVDLIDVFGDPALGITLLVVGDFEAGDAVPPATKNRVAMLPHVVRSPWMDNPTNAYAAMDVLTFPSYREGLPNVPLEAQLCGVPVVAYAATGTVDALLDGVTGELVDVGDRHELARRVIDLVADPARASQLGAAGTAWVTRSFDQATLWKRIETIYRS